MVEEAFMIYSQKSDWTEKNYVCYDNNVPVVATLCFVNGKGKYS